MFTRRFTSSIHALRDAERGRRAFVLGNGPSVLEEDLGRLRDEVVIGMNASTMLEREHGFQTPYYVVSDGRFLGHPQKRRWATSELSANTLRFIRGDLRGLDDPSLRDRTCYVAPLTRDGFSRSLDQGYYYGCTTTMLAVQLAWHLGCSEVFLLGVDLRYAGESPRFYAESEPQLEDSFTSVQIWNLANAGREMARAGRRLVNCSRRSFLRPHLPFEPFASVLPGEAIAA